MDVIIMFYRANTKLVGPAGRFDNWQSMVVNEQNSAKSDGKTFDIVRHYQDNPRWEVHLVETTLPN